MLRRSRTGLPQFSTQNLPRGSHVYSVGLGLVARTMERLT